jgi:ribonuclease HII
VGTLGKIKKLRPSTDRDASLEAPGFVFGLDEVGRGCLAGPVVAACFAFPITAEWVDKKVPVTVADSKTLDHDEREEAVTWLKTLPGAFYAVAEASVPEIDRINILWASMLAMVRSFEDVRARANPSTDLQHRVLVDGHIKPRELVCLDPCFRVEALVKGDYKSFAIAAASIFAKQHRDALMRNLASDFPHFGWQTNVGYATPEHREALGKHGPTIWHRRSFTLTDDSTQEQFAF